MTLFRRLVTVLVCLFVALPLLWLLYMAFLPPRAVLEARLLPTGFSLANFGALAGSGLWRALLISLVTSGIAVLGQLVIGIGAAYAIRTGLRALWLVLLALALPLELLLVPLFRVLQQLGLLDSPLALVAPFLASPLVIFLLYQSIRRLPWEMVEAASLDGAGHPTILARVVVPALLPEIVAAGILGFAAHWNLVLFPKVMIGDRSWWTVQVWLAELLRNRPLEWGLLGAAAFLSAVPIVVLYLVFERRIVMVFERSFG